VGVKPTLRAVLKQPKLAGLVPILPDHAAYTRKASLPPLDFLELALRDETDRREPSRRTSATGSTAQASTRPSPRSSTGTSSSPSTVTASVTSSILPLERRGQKPAALTLHIWKTGETYDPSKLSTQGA
jgi:hypothetical protein